MGPSKKKGKGSSGSKFHKKYTWSTHARVGRKDLDEIYVSVEKIKAENVLSQIGSLPAPPVEYNDDLPGAGQYYCVETGRYFANAESLEKHRKTKFFKRRVKELQNEKKYTQEDADLAAGLGKEKLPPVSRKETMEE